MELHIWDFIKNFPLLCCMGLAIPAGILWLAFYPKPQAQEKRKPIKGWFVTRWIGNELQTHYVDATKPKTAEALTLVSIEDGRGNFSYTNPDFITPGWKTFISLAGILALLGSCGILALGVVR